MYSSRLFWKLLVATAGLSLLGLATFGAMLSRQLQQQVLEQLDRRLHDSAHLLRGELAEHFEPEPVESLQRRIRLLGKQTGVRFTIIGEVGKVLADSDRATLDDVRAMDNHRDRPEVVQARTLGEGRSKRPSTTLAEVHRYYVVRIDDADGRPLGYVRSSVATSQVSASTAAVRRWTWLTIAAVWLCMLAASYLVLRHILQPLNALTRAADAIAAGDYQHRLYLDNRDEFGALARTFGRISYDLNQRTGQVDQTLRRQSTVLGGMTEGVVAVDDRLRIVLANSAAGRLFHFPVAAAEGRPLLEIIRNHSVHDAVTSALRSGQPQRVETKSNVQNPTSSDHHIDVHVQPLPGEPCRGVVLVVQDTTALRRLESLRRDFIANVSHELKTPLSSIKAYTETLRNGTVPDDETRQKFLGRIEEQSDRLNRLISDMLMLARIESEQQPFEIVAIDLTAIVGACIEDQRAAAEAKGIDLTVEPTLPPCRVSADREGLREILTNLIDNAIKYTPEGGRVTVGWEEQGGGSREQVSDTSDTRHPTPDTQAAVFIHVRDTGIGIKSKDQERVFERFYRVDKERSRELGGTGLGLAIVKHLTQSFGGRVSVASEPGQGSTFTVELPSG